MFSTHPKTNFNFSTTFNLSFGNAFNLDQSKILSFGKELNKYHTILTSNLHHTILTFIDLRKKPFETILEKRIKCWSPAFSPFPKTFSSLSKAEVIFEILSLWCANALVHSKKFSLVKS